VAFEQLHIGARPSSAAAQLGTAVHLAVEKLLSGADSAEAWNAACDELASRGPDPRRLPGGVRTELRFQKRSPQLQELVAGLSPVAWLVEEELLSGDGSIGGTADLIVLRDRDLVVIDHKTGFASDAGVPKPAYERQVRIYAALASERFDLPAARGVLMSMAEGVVDVDVTPALVAAEMAAARSARQEFNERAPGSQPAAATPQNCQWCDHKARCDAFWDALSETWRDEVGECVVVELAAEPQVSANGLAAMRVEIRAGTTVADGEVVVAEVPEALVVGLGAGATMNVTGLRRTKSDRTLRWAPGAMLDTH